MNADLIARLNAIYEDPNWSDPAWPPPLRLAARYAASGDPLHAISPASLDDEDIRKALIDNMKWRLNQLTPRPTEALLPCPPWCSPDECDVHGRETPHLGGAHRSEPIQADFGPLVPAPSRFMHAYLYQPGAPDPSGVFVVFEVGGLTLAAQFDEGRAFALELAELTAQVAGDSDE